MQHLRQYLALRAANPKAPPVRPFVNIGHPQTDVALPGAQIGNAPSQREDMCPSATFVIRVRVPAPFPQHQQLVADARNKAQHGDPHAD